MEEPALLDPCERQSNSVTSDTVFEEHLRTFKYSKSKFSQDKTNLLSIINGATCFDS